VTNAQLYERVHRAKVEWERTFDAISDPIAVFDARGRTMRVNAALAALRGWPITQTQGRTCAEVGLCGGGCPDCVVGLASREQHSSEREVETGEGRIFAVTTLPITGPSGAVVQFGKEMTEERRRAAQLRDLSQELRSTNAELVSTLERLRTTQAQLVQSEKLSAIGLLVAGVAHELNNPLTSVIGYAQLVNDELASRPDLAEAADSLSVDVSRILTESERAARIVRNLLTFARSQSSERERQDLADLCARVVQLRAYDFRLKEIEVVTRFSAGLPPVHADGGQIQQVLLNLLLNAEQAMKKAEMRRLEISVGFEADCGAVLTEIRDTGHGIETSNLRRIFDPFFTTRGVGEGTGLGLSIAYGIVRDHGGQIWAESRPERTSFFIRLPARIDAELADRIGTVLVAHGDPVMRDFLGAVFAGWGFVVRSVPDLAEALESLAEDDIGLAVVDRTIVEPDPGRWEAAWARCPRRPTLIVIALSSAERETVRFFRSEAPVVLAPPYDLYQIRCALLAAGGVES
jgi:signal transduction histidine kinase/CheY-like chemotaxis protein